jgi:hypothetical protein
MILRHDTTSFCFYENNKDVRKVYRLELTTLVVHNTGACSLVRKSAGLLIRRSGVQIPSGPLKTSFEILTE